MRIGDLEDLIWLGNEGKKKSVKKEKKKSMFFFFWFEDWERKDGREEDEAGGLEGGTREGTRMKKERR